jgi:hypothetical protein
MCIFVDTREVAGAGFQGNEAGPLRAAGRRLTPLL